MPLSYPVIANQSADWCGNLLRLRRFSRQCVHWLRMTENLNLAIRQAHFTAVEKDKMPKKKVVKLSIPTIVMGLQIWYYKHIQVDSAYSTK